MGICIGAVVVVWMATRPSMSVRSRAGRVEEPAATQADSGEAEIRYSTLLPGAGEKSGQGEDIVSADPIESQRFHIVRRGETLSQISSQYYGSSGQIEKILQANRIEDADRIKPGTKLIIPW